MKPIVFFLLVFILFSCSTSSNHDPNASVEEDNGKDSLVTFDLDEQRLSAVDFNNEINLMLEGMLAQVDILFASSADNIDVNLENALFEVEIHSSKILELEGNSFVNAKEFKTAVIKLFDFYQDSFNSGFKTIVVPEIKSPSNSSVLNEFDEEFAQQEKLLFDSVFYYQEKFARSNNIKLEEK